MVCNEMTNPLNETAALKLFQQCMIFLENALESMIKYQEHRQIGDLQQSREYALAVNPILNEIRAIDDRSLSPDERTCLQAVLISVETIDGYVSTVFAFNKNKPQQ